MTRRLIIMSLLIASFVGSGCLRAVMNLSSRSFFSSFSLEDLVKKNSSPSARLCARNGLGGAGSTIVGYGRRSSGYRNFSFSCQIGPGEGNIFDEVALLTSLKADVEDEIAASGAKVTDQGGSGPAAFFIEYVDHDVRGRMEISGNKSVGSFYTLQARLEESGGSPTTSRTEKSPHD